MTRISTMFLFLAVVGFAACDKGTASPEATGHGVPGAEPGSHEDWCGEHQVAESQCTRCNATLIPVFKASDDWCDTHGLPESQCLACNPDLKIERPAKATP